MRNFLWEFMGKRNESIRIFQFTWAARKRRMAAAGMKAPCGAERVGTRWTVDIKNILNNKRPRAGIGIFSHFFPHLFQSEDEASS
ncbi:hypothetical protein DM77_1292 [Burkholderia mallei]|nr:hypothetical protein DM46_1405 [Burkholderia mallei]KOT07738.1 hypothetical protein DM77_1292 [Burkholderia mallei]